MHRQLQDALPWRMPCSQPRCASFSVGSSSSGACLSPQASSAKRAALVIGLVKQLHSNITS